MPTASTAAVAIPMVLASCDASFEPALELLVADALEPSLDDAVVEEPSVAVEPASVDPVVLVAVVPLEVEFISIPDMAVEEVAAADPAVDEVVAAAPDAAVEVAAEVVAEEVVVAADPAVEEAVVAAGAVV